MKLDIALQNGSLTKWKIILTLKYENFVEMMIQFYFEADLFLLCYF